MAARVPEPAAALVAFALLPAAALELRMVLPDRRTLPLLVDVPADALSLPLTDVLLIPIAAPFCLALPLLLPPVPFMDGIPRSSKAAATSAALGLPPTRRLPEPLPIAGLLIPLPPLLAEETALAELALGDVGIPVPAMRFLRAARAASAAVVAVAGSGTAAAAPDAVGRRGLLLTHRPSIPPRGRSGRRWGGCHCGGRVHISIKKC